jgi:hypothetical protein
MDKSNPLVGQLQDQAPGQEPARLKGRGLLI